MLITDERIAILTKFLNSDEERGRRLFALDPEVAVKQINELGYDFTADELRGYGQLLEKAIKLEDEALEGVAGGISRGEGDFMSPMDVDLKLNTHDVKETSIFFPFPTFVIAYGIPPTTLPGLGGWGRL